MSTLFHSHVTCILGDFLIGLGTRVRAFKPSCEAFQAVGESTNHLHYVHHSEITTLISWWFTSPIYPVISRSSWPWSSCTIHCFRFLTIWSSMPLKSAMITHIVWSRTSLWSWTGLGSRFRPAHRLITRVVHHPLVLHIPLLLNLGLFSNRANFNWLFGLYELHFFSDIARWATPSGISQPRCVWKALLWWNNII